MAKITHFTGHSLQQLRTAINNALAPVGTEFGIKLEMEEKMKGEPDRFLIRRTTRPNL